MIYTASYQMYKYEHRLTPAEQRAADVRAGEAAAAVRDLRFRLGRAFRPSRRATAPARATAAALARATAAAPARATATAPVQVLSR